MTAQQLKDLETRLWAAADQLRANSKLTATEYSFPVLGLIFLRHASRRYNDAKVKIEASLPVHPQRGRRALTKADFQQAKALFLPERATWQHIAHLPEAADIGEELNAAMKLIEEEHEALNGVLPKDYQQFEKDLLQRLVRIFNAEELDKMPGDVFGRIYEYFLNEFAKSGAQEGGEFFTPPSLVNTIVAVIEPDHGIVFDPACGSAGMFVQTGHFIEEEGENPAAKVTFYGQEKADTNTRLAKMNVAVHGLEASILQGNTFYEDHHGMTGRCDFVMANPPFNVGGVDKNRDSVKNDRRLPFGLPKTDNANYLWISYFYAYLNPTGRAGFVMASSASDAGHSERDIREALVKTGAVDVMVSIGTKFFYTRSLPCTLWFFDRAKEGLSPDPSPKERGGIMSPPPSEGAGEGLSPDPSPKERGGVMSPPPSEGAKEGLSPDPSPKERGGVMSPPPSEGAGEGLSPDPSPKERGGVMSPPPSEGAGGRRSADTTLMLDLRDVFRKVSSNLHDFTPEQLRNIKAIVGLYRGNDQPYIAAIENYHGLVVDDVKEAGAAWEAILKFRSMPDENLSLKLAENETSKGGTLENLDYFKHLKKELGHALKELAAEVKTRLQSDEIKKDKTRREKIQTYFGNLESWATTFQDATASATYFFKEMQWLTDRFPEGKYQDVPGLCRVVTRADIAANDYSLTAGRYVGVAAQHDDGEGFEERMAEIKMELADLDREAATLAATIQEHLNELGL